ncbi:cytochrome c1 [Roseateles depolymerans]|uniref:Cytochrome C n=1 Tax=Roseateles depolymerans TaxID=76731 RepID=A0A0U3ME62_9BURK|nr:cytochrome c1 [Roseateles depolymerans]ALV05788.1 cytochrome C [Roseateles depolymerans]REG12940.1 ubiquinol-cytochrome c reductase cytochrome c1 subunit [Roseateles depolymerans]
MKKLIALLVASLALGTGLLPSAQANEAGPAWDQFPVAKMNDVAALQRGAKMFVNYCLNCHSAAYMRYNRLKDLQLTDEQIKNNLLFAGDKVGETMKVSLDPKQAKAWFGAAPPDLSVIARSRADGSKGSGADYLYTYLRKYYRDETKATGWNNLVFPSVAMPHVLWELQGVRTAKFEERKDPHDPSKVTHVFAGFEQVTPGTMSPQQFDDSVADLVAYLQWMGEPAQGTRFRLGVIVVLFLLVFTVFAWRLNASFWKDVK